MDPRVKTPLKDLQRQHDLSMQAYNNRKEIMKIAEEISSLKNKTRDKATIDSLDKLINGAKGSQEDSFAQLNGTFAYLQNLLQESDMPPTTQMITAMKEVQHSYEQLLQKWNAMKRKLNE
jgi:hypothetical protein